MILPKSEIKKLIQKHDMITGYLDLDEQLQPNGFDLTLDKILMFSDGGIIGKKEKKIPCNKEKLPFEDNYFHLYGINSYLFTVNETVKLPLNVCAMTIQRSSIMRCGVITNIGFWDSGYNGKGFSTLNIMNEYGIKIQKNTRIIQMVFMKNTEETEGYHGQYQYEGINIIKEGEITKFKVGEK